MPTIGILSQKTFFPKTGDVLNDSEDSTSWECVRAGVYTDTKTGTVIRFVLLIGRTPALGDTPIPKTLEDSEMPLPFLKNIDNILRGREDKTIRYRKNAKGNYEED